MLDFANLMTMVSKSLFQLSGKPVAGNEVAEAFFEEGREIKELSFVSVSTYIIFSCNMKRYGCRACVSCLSTTYSCLTQNILMEESENLETLLSL